MEFIVFAIAGTIVVAGALGVISLPNPVHAALSLVATLFGVAVLFLALEAHFLAAVQVIVYAGAIVVLFLFVIMLLGVDQAEDLRTEPLAGQRPLAVIGGVCILGVSLLALLAGGSTAIAGQSGAPLSDGEPNVNQLARVLFTDYVFAFEITAILLTIAVVGAVVLAKDSRSTLGSIDADGDHDPADERPTVDAGEERDGSN